MVQPGDTITDVSPVTRSPPSAVARPPIAFAAMAPPFPSELTGRVLAGRYRLMASLGAGGSARVYLADDTLLRRRVAVKVLHDGMAEDAAFLKRFRAETHAAAALNHTNIMHVYDSGTDGAVPYLVCEYLEGGSLRALLQTGARLTPSQALVIGLDVARGLAYAHGRGLIHRDIKPANLLFGDDDRLCIADFGLARAIDEAAWTEPEGMLLGTAAYTAPEQARGAPLDGRADVYSLALVLIEAVTGRVPFLADNPAATMLARLESDLPVPAEMGRLRAVLERAGRLDPQDRADAGELGIALLAAAEDMDRPEPLQPVGALSAHAAAEVADITELQADVVAVADGGEAGIDIDLTPVADEPAAASATDASEGKVFDALAGDGGDDGVEATGRRRRRRRWPVIAGVIVVALGGVGAFLGLRTPSAEVPKVIGRDAGAAMRSLRDRGWTVTTELTRRDGTRADEVLAQRPAAGTDLDRGKRVTLRVSLGNTLVAAPALQGRSEQDATAAITAGGLVAGELSRPNDEQAPAGTVISATVVPAPDASGQVPKGSKVNLVISAGPAPRAVPPNLVGASVDAARSALKDVQLGADVAEAFSDRPVGEVLSADRQPGEQVPRDTIVKLTVSKGPEPKPIPNVIGMAASQAAQVLSQWGFGVSRVDGSPLKKVLITEPAVGSIQLPGTPVRLVTAT